MRNVAALTMLSLGRSQLARKNTTMTQRSLLFVRKKSDQLAFNKSVSLFEEITKFTLW